MPQKTKTRVKQKDPPSKTYSATAHLSIHIEVDLGQVDTTDSAAAKRHFRALADSLLAETDKLELVWHSSHYGVDLVEIAVRNVRM